MSKNLFSITLAIATVMLVSCSQIESIETEEELLPVSIVESNDSQTGIVTTKVAAYVADVFISKYVDSKIVTKSSFKLLMERIFDGNGIYNSSWYSITNPGLMGGLVSSYFHMNWGFGYGGYGDGWFVHNNIAAGGYNFQYARQNFYITKPQ